jgi:hypothetical protein
LSPGIATPHVPVSLSQIVISGLLLRCYAELLLVDSVIWLPFNNNDNSNNNNNNNNNNNIILAKEQCIEAWHSTCIIMYQNEWKQVTKVK